MTNQELESLLNFEPMVGPFKQSCIKDFIFAYCCKNGFAETEAVEFVSHYVDALARRFINGSTH